MTFLYFFRRSASDISSSKAIVDLETSGNEGHEKIQSLLFGHLAMENTLNSLKVSPEVEIYEFGGKFFFLFLTNKYIYYYSNLKYNLNEKLYSKQ